MPDFRYQALGPLPSPGGTPAYLGLAILDEARAQPVVLVWVPEELARDVEKSDRVQRDTERAALLEHPHIVRVFGFARLEEGLARVVEFADGESLRKILEVTGPLPPAWAARLIADAAQGVHYAHLAGNDDGTPLLHGDIRPDTLLVSFTGHCKISGYGAAAFAPKESQTRKVRAAPEQLLGGREAMNVQTDVYLLGATLFELVTGKAPFQDEPDFDQAVLQKDPDPGAHREIPEALAPILSRALAKKAADRFPSALLLREALEVALDPLPSHAELAAWLQERFPDQEGARAERQRIIDAAIARFARTQWEKQEAAGPSARPPFPAVAPAPVEPEAPPASSEPAPLKAEAPAPEAPAPEAPPPSPPAAQASEAPPPPPAEATAAPPAPAASEEEAFTASPRTARRPLSASVLVGLVLIAAAAVIYVLHRREQGLIAKVAPPPALARDAGATPPPAAATPAPPSDAGPVEDAARVPAPDAGGTSPAAARPSGTLALTVQPRVNVEVDGKPAGRTPLRLALEPGRHRLRLHDRRAGVDLTRFVSVSAEGITTEEIYLQKGYVTLSAPPGAVIELDGRRVGTAPLGKELPVYEGSHRLEVTVGKAKWRESFSVKPNQRVYFDVGPQYSP